MSKSVLGDGAGPCEEKRRRGSAAWFLFFLEAHAPWPRISVFFIVRYDTYIGVKSSRSSMKISIAVLKYKVFQFSQAGNECRLGGDAACALWPATWCVLY